MPGKVSRKSSHLTSAVAVAELEAGLKAPGLLPGVAVVVWPPLELYEPE